MTCDAIICFLICCARPGGASWLRISDRRREAVAFSRSPHLESRQPFLHTVVPAIGDQHSETYGFPAEMASPRRQHGFRRLHSPRWSAKRIWPRGYQQWADNARRRMQGRKPAHPNLAHAGSHGLFRAAASGACACWLLRVSERGWGEGIRFYEDRRPCEDERVALGSGPLGAVSSVAYRRLSDLGEFLFVVAEDF